MSLFPRFFLCLCFQHTLTSLGSILGAISARRWISDKPRETVQQQHSLVVT